MIVKDQGNLSKQFLPGLILLVLGFAVGGLLDPISWWRQRSSKAPAEAQLPSSAKKRLPVSAKTVPDNKLKTIDLTLDEAAADTLVTVRENALKRGVIIQEEQDTVAARVSMDGTELPAEVRIKGDWTDHVKTDKWSLRIKLDGKLNGMRVFSIQPPQTRGWLWEWLVHEAARREGLLAPRSTFVNAVINGSYLGIFFLEEHFGKEMLESQQRREGPIVLFDETSAWSTYFQNHIGALGFTPKIPAHMRSALDPANAGLRAFGEGHLSSMDSLNRTLIGAMDKIENLQLQVVAESSGQSRARRLLALSELQGKTVGQLLDVKPWARANALQSVFQIWHGLIWHNMRFYYNPVSDRLEPIVFDNMAHSVKSRTPVIFGNNPVVQRLRDNPEYYTEFFKALGEYAGGTWLDGLLEAVEPDLTRYRNALEAETPLGKSFRPEQMMQRLRAHQVYLRETLRIKDAVNFQSYFLRKSNGKTVTGNLHVKAWSITGLPVVLEGFRFHDGSFVSARATLDESSRGLVPISGSGAVILPFDNRPIGFVFPINSRLANLSNVAEIKRRIRAGEAAGDNLHLDDIKVVYGLPASGETFQELLYFRQTDPSTGGRPPLPTLAQALEAHPFLIYNLKSDRLSVRPGYHLVEGDLWVPAGYPLHAGPGVVLRFGAGNFLYSENALIFKGSAARPVVLEPADDAPHFSGILVRAASKRSTWQHVRVSKTNSLSRGGWTTTGGITFYHAPVTMKNCRIEGTLAEDGTNIFGTDFLMEEVTFSGCISDSFDGDFVSGTVLNCTFEDGKADGLDFSGSDVLVKDCHFLRLGDKAVSVGERSKCRLEGGDVNGAAIGIASKDLSETLVTGTRFSNVARFIFAVYIKKAEFGPASITATDIVLEGSPANPYLVQSGSFLSVDGKTIKTQNVDVNKLYDEKVLGN